ncbi:MAG: protein arginine kinase [Verrucomicrobiota bacterium]|nr:protein arginine kinase [Verrucomicrobiota bacterium]
MLIDPLLESKSDTVSNSGAGGPIVLSTRIRLARNLAHYSFPGWAKKAQQGDVLIHCLAALDQIAVLKRGLRLRMDDLSDLEKQILVERHLISKELQTSKLPSGVYISKDASCSIMINEEDHLRIQMMRGGLKLKQLWKSINELDTSLEDYIDYAFIQDLGYLTACPTNVGTGMRASAMLHLPALVMAGHMEKVIRMVNQVGIAVRGLFGEGTDATGSIFQISNQQTLGESEEDILKRLGSILAAVINQEQMARMKMLEDNGPKFFDKIGRAYGTLLNAHMVNSEEAVNLLSLIRLAVDMGMLPEESRALVDHLLLEVQPGHVQLRSKQEAEASTRDILRAKLLREHLQSLPALKYSANCANKSGETDIQA